MRKGLARKRRMLAAHMRWRSGFIARLLQKGIHEVFSESMDSYPVTFAQIFASRSEQA